MIKNNSTDKGKNIEDLRNAIEHRATWFYYLVEEAGERGIDIEFARDAITRCGSFHGANKYTQTDDMKVFCKEFVNDNVINIFDMDIECTDEQLDITFHYCPLVSAWKKLTGDEEKIATLCDIAMDGDRGIASEFDAFEFTLGKTIAKGDDVCEVCFKKVKK